MIKLAELLKKLNIHDHIKKNLENLAGTEGEFQEDAKKALEIYTQMLKKEEQFFRESSLEYMEEQKLFTD